MEAADMDTTSVYVPRQSSERSQPVDPRFGGAGHGQVNDHTVAQTLTEEEGTEFASCVGNTVPHAVTQTLTKEEGMIRLPVWVTAYHTSSRVHLMSSSRHHDVGNEVPRHVNRRKSGLNLVQADVASSDSEARADTSDSVAEHQICPVCMRVCHAS
ncbi:hypothetical protein PInf_022156 [Phytophthora infestans]|nr:hypothetical protein PInf_022156 [Phytophthora infestans]